MREEGVAAQGLDDARDPVPAAHPQVVSLGDPVEAVDRHHGGQRVEDGVGPGLHLLPRVPGQEAEGLTADGVERTEDHDLAVLAAVDDGVEDGREGGLAGSGPAAEGHDADVGVEEMVDGDALLGGAAVHAEDLPVGADDPDLVADDGGQRRGPRRGDGEAGVVELGGEAVGVAGLEAVEREGAVGPQGVELLGADRQARHAGVAGFGGEVGTVLVGGQPHGGGLDAHGHVLGDDGDVRAGVGEPDGDGEDPGVVVPQAHAGGQDAVVRAVELDPQGAALVVERDGAVEASVPLAQPVEEPQGGAREVAELGVVALGLELGDDDDGQHDGVLVEAQDRAGVGQEDGGVQDVGAQGAALPVFHGGSPGGVPPRAPHARRAGARAGSGRGEGRANGR